ncbi:hypothetical protein [Candidatus Electronema sp. PJ]|uniref:hypothetical protein n=1 Tax=Candidatus Electronema sp. PJ TaxID=3401572 RepID=UPI003AA8895E
MEAVYCNSLAGGRIKLKRIVRDMMGCKDTRNLVLEVDPGVGKTRTALQQAAKYGHQRKIFYSAPNHELAEESYDRFCKLPGHPDAQAIDDRIEPLPFSPDSFTPDDPLVRDILQTGRRV